MIQRMSAAVIGGLMSAMKIVLLFVGLIALVHWAKANPAQAQSLLNKLMTTAAGVITWGLNEISRVAGS